MTRPVLGISAWYHDSAAALALGGEVVAAAQEERWTRVRHDAALPEQAMAFCLAKGGLTTEQLEWVAFYEKPLRRFDRILESHFATAPFGFGAFRKALPLWLEEKLHIPRALRAALGRSFKGHLVFTEHHEAHAASAFFPSPFERAAILTCDGSGEWATTTWGRGEGNRLKLEQQLSFPHSLGLLYSAFTGFCGFKVNSGEYKLMGLAPYGTPRFAKLIFERLIHLREDGSYRLAMEYFDFVAGLRMTNAKFAELFGGPARAADQPITERELDLAASIQQVTEEVLLRLARHVAARTGLKDLCLAGGVALNCVANGRLLREGPFERIWVQPAAGDAGGALGAALFTQHQLLGAPREARTSDAQRGSLLGPEFSRAEIVSTLTSVGAKFRTVDSESALLEETAALLDAQQVVGWFQGAMEFGPRALGSRSILGDARAPKMQSQMNLKIKQRESFRPFAPAVLAERAHEVFELPAGVESPYMLLTAQVKNLRTLDEAEQRAMRSADLLERASVARSAFPAITHVDGSARLQTVDAGRHGRFRKLLEAFHAKTGCPMLINTSFNVRGEPIVNTPLDAWSCFRATGLDALIIGDCVVLKSEQAPLSPDARAQHLARFAPD